MKRVESIKKIWIPGMLLFLALLAGCKKTPAPEEDILSQKPEQKDKMRITVLVKHAFTINGFERIVEEKFPDVDIVQVGSFTTAMSPDEYEVRMKNDDLTDIIMTWPLSFGEEYWEERLIDLSTLPITNRYNVSMLNEISKEGKLYYLPGPAQVRGIIYNKTLFEEKGWEVPENYDEFIALCHEIEASGIRAIQLGFQNQEVLDTAFIGYSYGANFSKPMDAQWIEEYSQGKGKFIDHFDTALTTFQDMIEEGIWKPEDLEVDYTLRENMLFSRECAMVEDSVLLTQLGRDKGSTDEFSMMPFFNPGGKGNDWTRVYMVCYIGLNKHLEDSGNKEKYDKVLEIMDYISTPEGQTALAADTKVMYSSLKGVALPSTPETINIVGTLEHGRYAIFKELDKVQGVLREGLKGMVAGELTKEAVAELVDKANASEDLEDAKKEVIGTATDDFTLIDTGSFIADVMKEKTDAQIALFLDGGKDGSYNNRGVTAKLYKGELTESDVVRVMPDYLFGERGELWTVTMKGADLIQTLEYAIPSRLNKVGWFYYFSGLEMSYNPTAKQGERIKEILLSDGTPIRDDQMYEIAIMENIVPKEYMVTCDKRGITIHDLVVDYMKEKGEIAPPKDGRFTVVK